MSKEQIIDYVMNTPGNTNKMVLEGMLGDTDGVKLPEISEEDEGKVLTVIDGKWDKGVVNSGDAGYSCTEGYATLFNGTATTSGKDEYNPAICDVSVTDIFSENKMPASLKVTFNGTEYICSNYSEDPDLGLYGATYVYDSQEGKTVYNWDEYPFLVSISVNSASVGIQTENDGTYQLQIEYPSIIVDTSECFKKAVNEITAPLMVKTDTVFDEVTSTTTYRLLTPSTEIYEAKQNGRSVIVETLFGNYCDVVCASYEGGCGGGSYHFVVCVYEPYSETTEFWNFGSTGTNEYAEFTPTV